MCVCVPDSLRACGTERKRRKRTSKRGEEGWEGEGGVEVFLDGMHTHIEGRQLASAIQSTKRRGAAQVRPLPCLTTTTQKYPLIRYLFIFLYVIFY